LSVVDDYDFIAQNAQVFVDSVCTNKCAHFNSGEFLLLHSAMQRQVLRIIANKLKGNSLDLENGQIEEMIKVIKSEKSKSQKAAIGGLNISKKGDKVDIRC